MAAYIDFTNVLSDEEILSEKIMVDDSKRK